MKTKIKYQNIKHYFMKEIEIDLQKRSNRKKNFEEILRSYVELENRFKALEEIFSINDSETNQKLCERNLFQTTEKEL